MSLNKKVLSVLSWLEMGTLIITFTVLTLSAVVTVFIEEITDGQLSKGFYIGVFVTSAAVLFLGPAAYWRYEMKKDDREEGEKS